MSTVLVIEDDPDMREIERTTLSHSGHNVVVAANGLEGLRALEIRRPCVILLDLMMPVMDGLTFLAERQRQHVADDVPILCVSAAGQEMVEQALRLGADDCIPKPADMDELCDRVARYCHKS